METKAKNNDKITVECNCGAAFKVNSSQIGMKGKCNKCGQIFVVTKDTDKLSEILHVVIARIKQGQFDQVRPVLEKLTAKHPDRADAWFYLSYCQYKIGDIENAKICAQKSAQLGHEKAKTLINKIEKPTIKDRAKSLVESLPVAEMYIKAGISIWMILGILMVLIHDLRFGMGFKNALAIFMVVVGIYIAYVCKLLFSSQKWINDNTTDPQEILVFKAIKIAAKRAGMPVPKIAIDRKYQDINAFTYGLGPNTARVVVTKSFLDKLNPTKEETRKRLPARA